MGFWILKSGILEFWKFLFLMLESGKLGIWTSGFRKAWIPDFGIWNLFFNIKNWFLLCYYRLKQEMSFISSRKSIPREICTPVQIKPLPAPMSHNLPYLSLDSSDPVCPKAPRLKASRPVGRVMQPLVLEPYFISHL